MRTYSEKYMAGLLDADGFIGVRCRVGARPDLIVEITQRAMYSDICEAFALEFGGHTISKHDGQHLGVAMRAGAARMCLERLNGFMVVKRDLSREFIRLVDGSAVLRSQEDVDLFRAKVKEAKMRPQTFEPNFPSRKWLAGYFDGDGSFAVVVQKSGYGYPRASILSEPRYANGVRLLRKAFGGNMCTLAGGNQQWSIELSQPSKALEFLGHFAIHLVEKKAQAYFLMGCAAGGNFRDGNAIRETVMALNTQQQRLNDPTGEAAALLRRIRFDIAKRKVGRPLKRQSTEVNDA